MRGYGRDYDGGRNWFERAEDTVRGWFGGGPSYDRDYPSSRPRSDWGHGYNAGERWDRGPDRGGYLTNNWNNQHANWETVDRASRGYYGADYDDGGMRGGGMDRGAMDYDRDFGDRDFGERDFGRDIGRDMGWRSGRGMSRGWSGGSMGGGTSGGMRGGGRWMGSEYGGGYNAGGGWGDYSGGGYGGDRWRNSTSGGVQPGRHFRGYGNGSTSGSGYEPY